MKLNAYAKINLTLDILGVRPDGFHALRSVMAPVSLCDEITFGHSDAFAFDCSIKELCTADNLCVRAAKLFFATVNKEPKVSVYLKKNIPFPAGLGGGSTDAATVLIGLNAMYGEPLGRKTLFSLAEELGSDVPFCLMRSPALCEGRGEEVTPLSGIPVLYTVIAIGKSRLKTPGVFKEYDAARLTVRNDTDMFLNAVRENDFLKAVSSLGNAFEPITDILAPETKQLRESMKSLGALNSRLSGSGPSVYGVFENERQASLCAKELRDMGYFAVSCRTINE